MTDTQRVPEEAIEAVLPYVAPDGYGAGTDEMRRGNAQAALQALLPALRNHFFEEFGTALEEERERADRLQTGLREEIERLRAEMEFHGHNRLPTDEISENLTQLLEEAG